MKTEKDALQNCIKRGCPYGTEERVKATAKKQGLEITLILSESFGTSRVQAAAVPEPSGFAVFAIALVTLARIPKRRR